MTKKKRERKERNRKKIRPPGFWLVDIVDRHGDRVPACVCPEPPESQDPYDPSEYALVVFDTKALAMVHARTLGGTVWGPLSLSQILSFREVPRCTGVSLNPSDAEPMLADTIPFDGLEVLYSGKFRANHRAFFARVRQYLRGELEYRKDPVMQQMLGWLHEKPDEVARDRELAEKGLVHLETPDGRWLYKRVSQLTPLDVPALMRHMAANEAAAGESVGFREHERGVMEVRSETTGKHLFYGAPGGAEDASYDARALLATWRELEPGWPYSP